MKSRMFKNILNGLTSARNRRVHQPKSHIARTGEDLAPTDLNLSRSELNQDFGTRAIALNKIDSERKDAIGGLLDSPMPQHTKEKVKNRGVSKLQPIYEYSLPVVLLSLIALSSFYILKTSAIEVNTQKASKAIEIDYFLKNFYNLTINTSRNASQLLSKGVEATHSATEEYTHVKNFAFNATKNQKTYSGSSDFSELSDDGNQIIMRQNVMVQLSNFPLEITDIQTTHLEFTQYPNRIHSKTPNQIKRELKMTRQKIESESLDYDLDLNQILLLGNVKIESENKKP